MSRPLQCLFAGLVLTLFPACLQQVLGPPPVEIDTTLEPVEVEYEQRVVSEQVASDPPPLRLLEDRHILGACLEQPDGNLANSSGSELIEDLLIDPKSGDVLWVETRQDQGASQPHRQFLEFAELNWITDPSLPTASFFRLQGGGQESPQDYERLFEGRALIRVSGEIMQVDEQGRGGRLAIVKLRDGDNLRHRVLIEPARVIRKSLPWLVPGKSLRVEGVETRDGIGKLLVAYELRQASETLSLRDERGVPLWDELATDFLSARELAQSTIRTVDGAIFPIEGWTLDGDLRSLRYLHIQVDGERRVLPFEDLIVRAEGGWRVAHDANSIQDLPDSVEELEQAISPATLDVQSQPANQRKASVPEQGQRIRLSDSVNS